MPTPNPRLSVVLTPYQRDLLAALGAHQGRSAASYVRMLLDSSTPHLRALLASLDHASEMQAGLPNVMDAVSVELATRLERFEESNSAQLDLIADVLEKHGLGDLAMSVADMIPRERSEGGSMAAILPDHPSRPPYSNTGVRLTEPGGVTRKKRQKSAISQGG